MLARAAAVHVTVRLLAAAAVVAAAAVHPIGTGGLGGDVGAALGKSDGVWYLAIAHHGYGPPPPIGPNGVYTHLTSLAFFPLYPLLVRAVACTGLPYLGAALLVTAVAGTAAAGFVAAWARPVVGDRGAIALVAVWELLPSSIVLSMAYSEALFVAAAACCLWALQRHRWLAAGLAAGIGGLTRPTGGCLVLAVAVAGLLAVRRRQAPVGRVAAAVVLGLGGLAVSLGHVAHATGRLDGWFWLERTVWGSGFDGGRSAFDTAAELLTGGTAAHRPPDAAAAAMVLVALALLVIAVRLRSRLRIGAGAAWYTVSAAVLAVGERGYFYVKPRLLFVAFPGLAPVAAWLARQHRRRVLLLAGIAAPISLAYNAYLLVGWSRAL